MAFREDADALHARIESLEKELEDARTELRDLRGVAAERDRLKARLEALEPKKKEKQPPKQAPRPGAGPSRPAAWQRVMSTDVRVLGALVASIVLGLGVWWAFAAGGSAETAAAKRGDTRVPSLGVVDLSATPDPAPIAFTVTGTDSAPGDCRGYLPDAPQLVLRTSAPMLVRATTRCNVDLVAVMTDAPAGLLCDDDSGGSLQPMIQTTLRAGDTRLTIGTYSEGASASCEIELHATALPDAVDVHGLASAATPRLATVALDGAPDTEVGYTGQLGATLITANTVQSGCPGFVGSVPDLVVEITEPTIVRIDAGAVDAEVVLLMGGPDGAFTCDANDGMGNSPRIAKRVAPGRYPIWVGSAQQVATGTDFHVGVRLATLASEAQRVVPSLDVVAGAPVHVIGWSGDELSAASMWSDCAVPGYVPYEPTTTLHVAARGDLTIASSRGDLLLAVTSHGERTTTLRTCTTEPEWRGTVDAGVYDLYVGVASGESTRSEIDLTVSVAPPSVLPYAP